MIGDVKMQTIKQRNGRSLTGDRALFLALLLVEWLNYLKTSNFMKTVEAVPPVLQLLFIRWGIKWN